MEVLFGNPDQVTGGLGTGIFGPNISEGNRTVPLVMTRGASEVGLYIASAGKQSAMLGFFPLDEGMLLSHMVRQSIPLQL